MRIFVTHSEIVAAKSAVDHVLSVVEEFGNARDHQNAEPLRALLPKLTAYLAGAPGSSTQSSVELLVEDNLFKLAQPKPTTAEEEWFSGTGREA